ncbi:alpha-glucuronidase [Mucilaginibacter robiniae]|uniref:Xylan alpha-1,2-glucuronidase n=1 Tax=Mucilaginibacter robiniae TaxID=2728022 RepID=A0A7L5E8T1_9SPHI|nr:alpha-glucuronidase family glycosyl hydrolase [Mucilaginibacter robiniae]QJD96786.1 alpha-glucuronidase [Mucilaginibacter robiniae]
MRKSICFIAAVLLLFSTLHAWAEDNYRLWLRYERVTEPALYNNYRQSVKQLIFPAGSPTLKVAKTELQNALGQMLSLQPAEANTVTANGTLVIGTPQTSTLIAQHRQELNTIRREGYFIKNTQQNGKVTITIGANTDVGVLYGVFNFLKLLQTHSSLNHLALIDQPKIQCRILNHWDNLDRTVERGYAGSSLWKWHKLPGYIDRRYIDYARANASIGINATVVNNVNANALSLTTDYITKAAALAKAFRPYGIKLFLSIRFSAPVEIGGLKTADPLDAGVQKWWKDKADEIYRYIPDFGGFLVKANSEGQPGPQTYGRNHAEGANMLADALKPHGGIVMWRAFVYDDKVPDDRAKQAYNEFKPLDGQFHSNVIVQVKNGAIDFQPREPFHPLFGAMPKTPVMMEFQITQEYLGFSTHLVYLGQLFKETLASDTYAHGKGSTVAKVIDGQLDHQPLTGMAGVANIGSDVNWCGHPFAQANWYAFGRLAWNPEQSPNTIADDWLRMTFTNDAAFVNPVKQMMMDSREITVNYMTPLGLHHIMGRDAHYGPGPWVAQAGRPDWTAVYYHKADSAGVGFERSSRGSNAVAQYFPEVRNQLENVQTTPEKFLLWFHHVSWNYAMPSGRNLWQEMVHRYYSGVDSVRNMQKTWSLMQGKIDNERFAEVKDLLAIQEQEAEWWRNSCVLYFQHFSKMPIPAGYEKPDHDLAYYENQKFYFIPGTRGVQ